MTTSAPELKQVGHLSKGICCLLLGYSQVFRTSFSTQTEAMLQDGISQTRTAGGPCGPLTQKLISVSSQTSFIMIINCY